MEALLEELIALSSPDLATRRAAAEAVTRRPAEITSLEAGCVGPLVELAEDASHIRQSFFHLTR